MKYSPFIEAHRTTIASAIGATTTAAIPWIGMAIIRSGEVSTTIVLSTSVFIAMAIGAFLQWWVR